MTLPARKVDRKSKNKKLKTSKKMERIKRKIKRRMIKILEWLKKKALRSPQRVQLKQLAGLAPDLTVTMKMSS